ncbi:MAG: RNA polymerase subunit sigma [Bacteroidetes bacterium 4484_249]|nr:MAG: RNA polymerase subunit sigma [Bacteroidetes bacterium 4484_249]
MTDSKILEMCRNADSGNYGFNLLIRKYQEQTYWHIRRIVIDHDDANDLVQDTFVKVWKNLKNFREDSKLYTWIYKIATNEALSFLKKKKRKLLLPIVDYENYLSQKLQDDNFFNGDEIQLKLQKAILTLPEKQRLVFNMRYYDEMKYDDMSEVLGTSVGALKASFHIAVKKIENYIKEN